MAQIEVHVLHPSLVQGVGRYLHHRVADPFVFHGPEQRLYVDGLRGRVGCLQAMVVITVGNRADHARLSPCGMDDGFDEIGDGGFSVCAGDARHGQLPWRGSRKTWRPSGQEAGARCR